MKIRITSRFESFLSGTQLWATPNDWEAHGYGMAGTLVVYKIQSAPRRKDRSRTIEINDDQAQVLRGYAETLAIIGGDTSYDPDGRADLACARGMLRNLNKS